MSASVAIEWTNAEIVHDRRPFTRWFWMCAWYVEAGWPLEELAETWFELDRKTQTHEIDGNHYIAEFVDHFVC